MNVYRTGASFLYRQRHIMFSFGNSAGSTTAVPLGGNSLFQTPAASSSNQQQNQNQQSSFLTSTSNPTTTPSGAFNFGTSSGPSNSTFNFGGRTK